MSSTITDLVAGSGMQFAALDQRLTASSDRSLELFRVGSTLPSNTKAAVRSSDSSATATRLSPREREVAVLIGRGLSNRQIAEELNISIATVERHVANSFNKLGVQSRSLVAVWVVEQGLLPTDAH